MSLDLTVMEGDSAEGETARHHHHHHLSIFEKFIVKIDQIQGFFILWKEPTLLFSAPLFDPFPGPLMSVQIVARLFTDAASSSKPSPTTDDPHSFGGDDAGVNWFC